MFANFDNSLTVMQVEWAKSKAQANHWGEEVQLLAKEMCRVIEYFSWKARWWTIKAACRSHDSPEIQDGITAYGEKQANMYHELARSFVAIWHPSLVDHSRPIQWPADYMLPNVKLAAAAHIDMAVDT